MKEMVCSIEDVSAMTCSPRTFRTSLAACATGQPAVHAGLAATVVVLRPARDRCSVGPRSPSAAYLEARAHVQLGDEREKAAVLVLTPR